MKAIDGTCHAFDSEKCAHCYLGEYLYRFNRYVDLAVWFPLMISAVACMGRRTERWLCLEEVLCCSDELFCLLSG